MPGEQVHPVAPATAPGAARPLGGGASGPGVRFADRAAATRPGFAITADNAAVVAEICRRLDRLPLTVELAAARASALPLPTLADRLDDGLLAGRTAAPRHRSLTATVAWSLDLLPEPERALFRDLACSPAALTRRRSARCRWRPGAPAGPPRRVQPGRGRGPPVPAPLDHPRVRRAATQPRGRATSVAGTPPLLATSPRALPHLQRPGSGRWLAGLHRERDNLRAALEWAAGPGGDPEVLVGLGESLWHYWDVRGSRSEGLRWLDAALAVVGPTDPSAWRCCRRRRCCTSAGPSSPRPRPWPASRAARRRRGTAVGGRRVGLPPPSPGPAGRSTAPSSCTRTASPPRWPGATSGARRWRRRSWPRLHRDRREPDAARVLTERAAAHADAVGEELARGLARDVAASIEHRWGDRTVAKRLAEEALAHYRLIGYREGEASGLHLSGRSRSPRRQPPRERSLAGPCSATGASATGRGSRRPSPAWPTWPS